MNEYNYKELVETVEKRPTEENLKKLGEWFERYGCNFWNGECYAISEINSSLYPHRRALRMGR